MWTGHKPPYLNSKEIIRDGGINIREAIWRSGGQSSTHFAIVFILDLKVVGSSYSFTALTTIFEEHLVGGDFGYKELRLNKPFTYLEEKNVKSKSTVCHFLKAGVRRRESGNLFFKKYGE